jgi:P-type Ca2+ transporter type 2C
MSGKVSALLNIKGLSSTEIPKLQKQFGKNIFQTETSGKFLHIVWGIVKEPMFLLLVIACSLYFILGQVNEGIMMLIAMFLVATISLYQEVKSSNAIEALKQFTAPNVKVMRDAKEMIIETAELVPGDIMFLEEGMNVPADAAILQANDCTVNESIITGESMAVDKNERIESNSLYQGTTINSGQCIALVTKTGNQTVLGKLGIEVGAYHAPKTLLQNQINQFVRRLALFGLIGFAIIFFVNYLHQNNWAASLLFALTLAMSAVPEEIPVAFSSFMALGSYKMSKLGIISRQPQIIENLGAVSVICIDKTGTITENKMEVKYIYDADTQANIELQLQTKLKNGNALRYAALASELNPFDAMEKAIWEAYYLHTEADEQLPKQMIYEFPLEGRPPMMTHVYAYANTSVAAAKGAAERIIQICKLSEADTSLVNQFIQSVSTKGFRVIGVASAIHVASTMPAKQDDFNWHFEGLLALYDPPKKNIQSVIKQFYDAQIDVKVLTGDYAETAINIAGQVGIINQLKSLTGEQVMRMKEVDLQSAVKSTNIFARMFPDAKLKVIEALKTNGEMVAMLGDGVNDGPALKAANIGIAMGQRGTEIARQAADLILTDDNLERVITAIREGRKIFNNLKKAIRYIISIHIPIVLIAALPVIFAWVYPNIFSPIHIIFLELIMGPTCSIFFEREPEDENQMQQNPRDRKQGIFTRNELFTSLVQGVVITVCILGLYYYDMVNDTSKEHVRTMVFTTLILCNIFLTFVNRSLTQTIYYTIRFKNNLAPVILILSISFLAALHFIPFVRNLFQLTIISQAEFWICFCVAFASVMWFEMYKTDLLKLRP